ncbi:MAG: response regulator [Candidatus Saccharibacteria bacterium]
MKKTILFVEDDQILRDMYNIKLNSAGFNTNPSEDGLQALDWLNDNLADLAIVDILLPKMNGLKLIKAIRKDPRHNNMRIIILTNLTESDVSLHDTVKESLGVDAYFVKSQVSPRDLVDNIIKILE